MKACPLCKEQILEDAIKCRFCHSLLVPLEKQSEEADSKHATYIVDNDLMRFAKFAGATLGIFLIVGAFFFGFKLDNALEKAQEMQAKLSDTKRDLDKAQLELNDANEKVRLMKVEVERVLGEARAHLLDIGNSNREATRILVTLQRQRLDSDGKALLEQAKSNEPSKFRTSSAGGKLWTNGATVRIQFMDGSAAQKEKVKAIAMEWIKDANLTFAFDESEADIRISFTNLGTWSFVGTECLGVPKNEPTMNIAWDDYGTDETGLKGAILKHFGYALGLIPEHMNPKAEIAWDKAAIYEEFSRLQGWTKAEVDAQVFQKYASGELPEYRDYDPSSIMMIPIKKQWLLKGAEIPTANDLSASDKLLIAKLYPKGAAEGSK